MYKLILPKIKCRSVLFDTNNFVSPVCLSDCCCSSVEAIYTQHVVVSVTSFRDMPVAKSPAGKWVIVK